MIDVITLIFKAGSKILFKQLYSRSQHILIPKVRDTIEVCTGKDDILYQVVSVRWSYMVSDHKTVIQTVITINLVKWTNIK